MAIGEPSPYGVVFWLKSALLGTGLLLVGGILTLTAIFAYSETQFGGFSFATVGTSFLAAMFWSILGLIGTCYFSVPIATLLTGGTRMLCRELVRARRNRVRFTPAAPTASRR